MAAPTATNPTVEDEHDDDNTLDMNEIEEIIADDSDHDHAMDEDSDDDAPMDEDNDDDMQLEVVNDSKAYFDGHSSSSIFSIAVHPTDSSLFLTGGGDDVAHIWTSAPSSAADAAVTPRECKSIRKLEAHKDSVIATAFTAPDGAYAVTGGLDGQLQLFSAAVGWKKVDSAQEVEEIVWIASHPSDPLVAVGTNEGSVWLYDVDSDALNIRHVLYSHTTSCTAGTFTKSGTLLCTVSEDGSFIAWDTSSGQAIVALTSNDQRFAIEGGLYSVATSPSGSVAAVGGASGEIRIVGLPMGAAPATGGKRTAGRPQAGGGGSTGGGQAGQILAALNTHSESVESLAFHPTVPLLASGSVDGKIGLYDVARGFALRKMLDAHVDAVVKVEFAPTDAWVLTSCGIDGTVKRWDARAGVEIANLKGHLGGNGNEGEGGVLGFVQTRDRIITAGDDGVALVFELEGEAVTGISIGAR
ncbi:WD40-repeat-containing domain protein [Tricharina praecox]|uniref:WD40-repeat-containing domain protein n=1 Tax=Tricharina praecox TaxID=43433 RepID=UPI0022201342|nr:WD40-repeat-containing domain protein [Tricharina praecox]KAI5853422.1 WD40-repeat-containing domain protein [Tricharina praecox]